MKQKLLLNFSLFSGILADLLDTLATSYNFTWSLDADPDGNWGVQPLSGQSDWENATWGGNLGAVSLLVFSFAKFSFCEIAKIRFLFFPGKRENCAKNSFCFFVSIGR